MKHGSADLTPKPRFVSNQTLRKRILFFVGSLIVLSLFGSMISLFRITEVNQSLDTINRVAVPLGRLLTQMQSDADIYKREAERRLGHEYWKDPRWRPQAVPRWIEEVLANEIDRSAEMLNHQMPKNFMDLPKWQKWVDEISLEYMILRDDSQKMVKALGEKDQERAAKIYPTWASRLDRLNRRIHWAADEYDRTLRQTFTKAQSQVSELRTGLEIILGVIVGFSLLLLWLGERALRPLAEITELARDITRRGLRKEDKAKLPVSLNRGDEVSQLAREFHQMATALLEREKMVEVQKDRLEYQNGLLREMGELNENILKSIRSVLIVTDLNGRISQYNPSAKSWLGAEDDALMGSQLQDWKQVSVIEGLDAWLAQIESQSEALKIEPVSVEDRIYGGVLLPLRAAGEVEKTYGSILVLEDLTEEVDLQERLRRAENLAAIGRMSAQVAHEVRNPLHSIGLEAEMAAEMAARLNNSPLKQSLNSILTAVDRLEKITENYLKLSKLSSGKKGALDLSRVMENVLATYAQSCESQGVVVDWSREKNAVLTVWGDSDLLEQALGNLFRNSLQSLKESETVSPRIEWAVGVAETGKVWLQIRDNGPGVSPEVEEKLFKPFVTTKAQGTGLGLSFVKQVVEEHGGDIAYAYRNGASFEIGLPSMEMKLQSALAAEGIEVSGVADSIGSFVRKEGQNVSDPIGG